LTASSPIMEGRLTGWLDNRLEAYRTNSRKIPAIAGRVIPEPVYTRADYESQILQRLYADIAPYDPEGVLQFEWLNARGAIARFSRQAIEIRVMDVQECPAADVALCAAVVALLEALVAEQFAPLDRQQGVAIDPLEAILLATIRDADRAEIADANYLSLLGFSGTRCTAGELWRRVIDRLLADQRLDSAWSPALEVVLREGPLARRLANAVAHPDRNPRGGSGPLFDVYQRLAGCLDQGTMFTA
ncbi:MAG: glutamate-cysteine ligase family protein, partial [Planctomycetales bacterium]